MTRTAVDWDTYKTLCDTPGVWSRWMLEQTLTLLDWFTQTQAPDAALRSVLQPLPALLRQTLESVALPKPADHRGGSMTDMFELELSTAQVQGLLQIIQAAQAAPLQVSGIMARGLGGFEEAWREVLNSSGGDHGNSN